MIKETFLAICALTSLDCDSIEVEYKSLGPYIQGMAVSNRGELSIVISPRPESIRAIMVHEVAHLVEFERGNSSHNYRYALTCVELADKADVNREACDE